MKLIPPNMTWGDVSPRDAAMLQSVLDRHEGRPAVITADVVSGNPWAESDMASSAVATTTWTIHRARGLWPFIGDPTEETGVYEWEVAVSNDRREVAGDSVRLLTSPMGWEPGAHAESRRRQVLRHGMVPSLGQIVARWDQEEAR